MDIALVLILLAVFYLVPELLKRRKPKNYEYPQIPDRVPPPQAEVPIPPPLPDFRRGPVSEPDQPPLVVAPPTVAVYSVPEAFAAMTETRHHPAEIPPTAAATVVDDYSPWQGKLDQPAVMNGIIYAEILQAPRALRPLRPYGRR